MTSGIIVLPVSLFISLPLESSMTPCTVKWMPSVRPASFSTSVRSISPKSPWTFEYPVSALARFLASSPIERDWPSRSVILCCSWLCCCMDLSWLSLTAWLNSANLSCTGRRMSAIVFSLRFSNASLFSADKARNASFIRS